MAEVDFSKVARVYRVLEYLTFGPLLQRRRVAFLGDLNRPREALIVGDGDGRFTKTFLRKYPESHVTFIDISPEMVRLARERIRPDDPDSRRIEFKTEDFRTVKLCKTYDLVITHFFLDCFTGAEVESLIPFISGHMTGHAQWLISEFRIPKTRVWSGICSLAVTTMYRFFRFFTGISAMAIPDYQLELRQAGWIRTRIQFAAGGLLVSELWEFDSPR